VNDLDCKAKFPLDMEKLLCAITMAQEHSTLRQVLSADMADEVNTAKAFVVHAEDARLR
jgi:hypothetical protein